jgi:3-hydroxyacyl-CoA dehydrogenase
MSETPVSYVCRQQVGVISIDNPPVNALSQAVREGLVNALEQAIDDDSRVLLILCRGRT